MEIFTIDGKRSLELKKNRELLASLEETEKEITKEKLKQNSPFRLRKKTISNIVYLNIRNRRRMLKLIGENRNNN